MPKGYQVCVCGKLVPGPRTLICPACEQPLRKPKAGQPILSTDGEAVKTVYSFPDGYNYPEGNIPLVYRPAGEPPIKLRSKPEADFPDDDDLIGWAGDVRQAFLNKGEYLRNEGLIYWAQQQLNRDLRYRPAGDEMEYVKLIIGAMPDIVFKQVPV